MNSSSEGVPHECTHFDQNETECQTHDAQTEILNSEFSQEKIQNGLDQANLDLDSSSSIKKKLSTTDDLSKNNSEKSKDETPTNIDQECIQTEEEKLNNFQRENEIQSDKTKQKEEVGEKEIKKPGC